MVIHPGIPAQENPWTERGAWQATVHGIRKELDMNEQLSSNNNIISLTIPTLFLDSVLPHDTICHIIPESLFFFSFHLFLLVGG